MCSKQNLCENVKPQWFFPKFFELFNPVFCSVTSSLETKVCLKSALLDHITVCLRNRCLTFSERNARLRLQTVKFSNFRTTIYFKIFKKVWRVKFVFCCHVSLTDLCICWIFHDLANMVYFSSHKDNWKFILSHTSIQLSKVVHVWIDNRISISVCQPSDFTVEPSILCSMTLPKNKDLFVIGTLVLRTSPLQWLIARRIMILRTLIN